MTAIEVDIDEYLLWLGVHNYAKTTIGDRRRYLSYLVRFLAAKGVSDSRCRHLRALEGVPGGTVCSP